MRAKELALIVGAGSGLSASLARLCVAEGMDVALAARDTRKLADLVAGTGARALACDAGALAQVQRLFGEVAGAFGKTPDLVVYNASGRYRASIEAIEPEQLEAALRVTALGGFLVAQAAAKAMIDKGHGSILLTGATAPPPSPWASSRCAEWRSASRASLRRGTFTSPIS